MKEKAWNAANYDDKLPRKIKKRIFGKRKSKQELRKAIANLEFTDGSTKSMSECSVIALISQPFCPNCGCKHERGTGNMAEYPEHWEIFYCLRCGTKVGEICNSRHWHVLELNNSMT